MQKTLLILLLCSHLSNLVQAQNYPEITPSLEFSLGNREHTSRDELIQMSKDPTGNLLLLGFVEGDSIFADVSLQKISPEGNLIWDHRFDSKNGNNYDVPVKMAVDKAGNTTVLGLSNGITSYFSPQLSNGYLYKVSAGGQVLWQVEFDTLLPPHASGLYCDGYMDTLGNFYVTYSLFVEFGERPTYFMKFDPDGNLLQSFTKFDIAQPFGGGPAAIGQALDSIGNFVFIHWDEEAPLYRYSVRKINPQTAAEQYIPVDSSGLSTEAMNNYPYLSWVDIWADEYGEIYTANNLGYPLGPAFFLAKINAGGGINYIIKADSTDIHFASLETWRGNAYVTGSYVPKQGSNSVAFVWKINSLGQREYEITASTASDCVPRFLELEQGKLFWVTQDVYTGQATLRSLNAGNLTVQWEYALHNDPSYQITGSNITTLSNGLLALAGTLRKEKQPGSSYLSEEEFYVETFSPIQNELYSQYQMTENGTTHMESIGLAVDAAGNKYVKTYEVDGPEYYLIQYAPKKYYYHKFTPDWTPVWTLESRFPAYASAQFYADNQGNTYTFEIAGQDSLMFQKISPGGSYVGSYLLTNAFLYQVFIDRQNNIHLAFISGNGVHTSIMLDNNFQPLQPAITGLRAIVKFQLPGDDAVYYYMEDEGLDAGEEDVRILLFKNGQMVWERIFISPPFPFSDFDVDPNTGDLLALSAWYNSMGGHEHALHRFSLDNTYTQAVINNGVFEGVYDISLMPNGNAYVVYENRLDLYNINGVLEQTLPIGNAPSGGNFFNAGDVFYRVHNGTLEGFSENGTPLFAVSNESFSLDPGQLFIDADGHATSVNVFGELKGFGYDYGWRWLRGRIRSFDLTPLLSTKTQEPVGLQYTNIHCQPVPASDVIQIDLQDFIGKSIQLTLTSVLGKPILLRQLHATASYRLDVGQVPAGQYFLTVHSEGAVATQKVLIVGH